METRRSSPLRPELTIASREQRSSGFAPRDADNAVDAAVKGDDLADARRLGLSDQVRVGEVQAVDLVDLERAQQRGRIERLYRWQGNAGAHQRRDLRSLDLVERFEHVDALGEHQVGEE